MEEKKEKLYFDFDALIKKIHNRIVIWHNNEEKLSPEEMGRELKWITPLIIEDVLRHVHNDDSIKIKNDSMPDMDK